MKPKSTYYLCFAVCLLLSQLNILHAQVGVNTTSPNNSSAFQVESTDKGIILPRVALTGVDDTTTITPSATTGLIVYNTASVGTTYKVTPGFYYWNGSLWRRLRTDGYSLKYSQTAPVLASTSSMTSVDLPGLDTGVFTPTFSGTYQIMVTAYMAAGNKTSSGEGATQGSIRLVQEINTSGTFTSIKETYLTSSSKETGTTDMENLAQSGTILLNVDLDAANDYRFKVQGREWRANMVATGSFGKSTSGYTGAGGVADAQYGDMTITLVKQK